jgi:chromosome partitioning protein
MKRYKRRNPINYTDTPREDDMTEAPFLTNIVRRSEIPFPADMPMQTLVFTSQKGGSGKTTLCGQLAVQAQEAGAGPVALIDTDPQGSLADWWQARGDDAMTLVQPAVDCLADALQELRAVGVKLVFIDTQPTVTDKIRKIVGAADLVVIPTRPSPHDLRAVGPTLDLVEACEKPMVFAINSATRRARITSDAAVALSQHGVVAPVTIHNRIDFATSMIDGRSVVEMAPESQSSKEIKGLWAYIEERLRRLKSHYPRLVEPAPEPEDSLGVYYNDIETVLSVTVTPIAEHQARPAAKKSLNFGFPVAFGRRGVAREVGV